MSFFDLNRWQEIFSVMWANRLRTALTAFSVWWGIFMLVLLLGSSNGLKNSFERQFADTLINLFWVRTWKTSEPFQGLPKNRRIELHNSDIDLLKSEFPDVELAIGRYYLPGEYFISRDEKSFQFEICGTHPGRQQVENLIVLKGRYLNDSDLNRKAKICIIGQEVEKSFFQNGEAAIGEYLTIQGIPFKVAGVFMDEKDDDEDRTIYIPITTAQSLFAQDDVMGNMIVAHNQNTVEGSSALEAQIRAQLAAKYQFDRNDRQALRVYNNMEEYAEFNTVFIFINGFIWFVGIGSLIAGMIGVSNIMLITVSERIGEFGIRKAIGATNASIIGMVIQESIVLTSLAGLIGLLTGYGLITGIDQLMQSNDVEVEFFYNPEVDLRIVVSAIILLVIVGVIAGIAPARKATSINTAEALKM
ncbi:MAG: ABC transporter permease [Bacteroidota bacterium]